MKTTEENNKLIAEFMGGTYKSNLFNIDKGYIWLPLWNMKRIDNLKYHTSWDWLMPVVEKIGELEKSDEADHQWRFIFPPLILGNIKGTYSTVIEFIEWYNKQNTGNQ